MAQRKHAIADGQSSSNKGITWYRKTLTSQDIINQEVQWRLIEVERIPHTNQNQNWQWRTKTSYPL